MFLRLAVARASSTFSNNSEAVKLIFVHISHIHHICINSLVPIVKKINIGNPGIQVNYWGGG